MDRCPQGSARPSPDPTSGENHARVSHASTLSVGALTAEDPDSAATPAAELDAAVFVAPYIVINRNNHGLATADTAAEAWTLLAQLGGASVVGTARPGIEVLDVDAADVDADPEAGEAASEDLRDWLAGYGLPYQRRASGRPGGFHLLAAVPALLLPELARQVETTAQRHAVAVTLRRPRTLRLLAAPHRHGLPAPLLDGTLQPADVPSKAPASRSGPAAAGRVCKPTKAPSAAPPRTGSTTADRSAREYGRTCAAIRRGLNFQETWKLIGDCQVAERGQLEFRQYIWFPATTTVAAENGLDESEAWASAQEACTVRARALGRKAWRERYWLPAVDQAAQDRPRRRRLAEPSGNQSTADSPDVRAEQTADIERYRQALHQAAADLIAQHRPQRQRSIRAVLDALAVAFVTTEGSIDVRTLAERSRVSKGVTIEVKKALEEHQIIAIAEHYAGGADHCHRYILGKRAEQALPKKQTTRWYTPTPATPHTHGLANPAAQRRQHQRERHTWGLRCELQQATQDTGEKWATSQHPAAKTARSIWAQRRRWTALSEEEQAARRQQRRAHLGTLGQAERRAWFDWLQQRDDLCLAAARARRGEATSNDRTRLAAAPATVHLGMRDRGWFAGYVLPEPPVPLELEFAEPAA